MTEGADGPAARPDPPFARLCGGAIGGKGEGLALLAALVEGLDGAVPGLRIAVPRTATIGLRGFEAFMAAPGLRGEAGSGGARDSLRAAFLAAPLPPGLEDALRAFMPPAGRPLIARSSSLLEDASDAPFSGVYESYAIPNAHPDPEVRLGQLAAAVKLVYASLYSPGAEAYREAARCADEAEEMAVLVQELVGSRRGRWFYPVLSGAAQSYNFYPVSHARPEDGLCEAALGLGSYVVDGGATHRFCPRWPAVEAVPPELAGAGAQTVFRALDMELAEPDLALGESAAVAELPIAEAEGTEALELTASTWDREDRRLVPGTMRDGPRVLDFAPILKYDALPLAPALAAALASAEAAAGGPVELEFALDAGPGGRDPRLYLLQLKKLRRAAGSGIDLEGADPAGCFIVSERAMGDGRIAGIRDVLWIDPEGYDRSRSLLAAEEVASLDRELGSLGRPYLLIGPGRWGSRDPWLGVPVDYTQIAHAAAIVETELPGFAVDFSFGSHFLRNVAGRGVGYLSVGARGGSTLDWGFLRSRRPERTLTLCARTRLEAPLEILLDGLRGRAVARTERPAPPAS